MRWSLGLNGRGNIGRRALDSPECDIFRTAWRDYEQNSGNFVEGVCVESILSVSTLYWKERVK